LLQKSHFPLNVPYRLARKIKKNSLDDPIFKQFIPLKDEAIINPQFVLDPVEDTTFCKSQKLLQKYKKRALLLTTSACAMHCRYCFRQNFSYETVTKGFEKELQLIQEDKTLQEVILSGGDPLSLSNKDLKALLISLDKIPHLKRIRFHTRFVIGIPERVDEELLSILHNTKKQIYFVIHCNHPTELDSDIIYYLDKVKKLSIPILCQTVLLKGVNDDKDTMLNLCEQLIDNGIIPYYLHQLDKVQGASHFEVEKSKGLEIISELRKELSGYGVFSYVEEIANKESKLPILQ
jgi:EF-P beta-lysylation protein EpmB